VVVRGKGGSRGGGKGGDVGKGEEMTQTLYAHMNKIKIKKRKKLSNIQKRKT
jgi:hypothetical protein